MKKIYSKLCARYSEDISGPQCTNDIRSVCEYLRVATDYSVQVSLTTQIILSHDDNQTKIVTTAIIILTLVLVLAAAGSDCNIHLHKMLPTTNSATDFFMFQLRNVKGYGRTTAGSPNTQGRRRIWPKASDDF